VIGTASIDRALASDGERVQVALGEGTVSATVAPIPLYDTEKRRPRS
jgi:glycine cleavage system aminomethyltransferase T